MAVLHTETFVIFDFDPSFISRPITDFDLHHHQMNFRVQAGGHSGYRTAQINEKGEYLI